MDQVTWGILAVDLSTGETLYARNESRKFIPASNAKVLVTAAALLEMGPDYRFETAAWPAGELDPDGTLQGDLVIPGDGDPTLSERYWADDEAPLRALVDSLRMAGLRSVQGQLVVDASAWDSIPIPSSWMVGNIPWGFSAVGAPFAVAEGSTRIVVEATEAGAPARVSRFPWGRAGFLGGEVMTVEASDTMAEVNVSWMEEQERHLLWGTIAEGGVDTLSISTRVPATEAGYRLMQLLDSAGIQVHGGLAVLPDSGVPLAGGCASGTVRRCNGSDPLARLTSPPLSEVAKGILEPSQNWMTEQLVRALAGHRGERGSWSAGLDAVSEILQERVGIDSLDVSLRDGSGLSAYNLVTPRALVAVLRHMQSSPLGPSYREALAAPAEEESTLENRLLDLRGRVQAKTGTISNVNSLSGYLVTHSGREVVFSILSNGSGLPSSLVRERIDDVVRALARYR
jgi:D-alanyl-D-alanine carboxypeptidase/D-alanyl-D-alanine-endopeptidase (penicillin-binding protein 4)